MILIGLGSNLTTEEFSTSRAILEKALKMLEDEKISVIKCSRFYETEPVPKSDQPWYVNAVAQIETSLDAVELLAKLHEIERNLGRTRRERWEARVIDLDLLCYDEQIFPSAGQWCTEAQKDSPKGAVIPHARMHERDFVLIPLMDIVPDWRHPVSGKSIRTMLSQAKSGGIVRVL